MIYFGMLKSLTSQQLDSFYNFFDYNFAQDYNKEMFFIPGVEY